MNVSKTKNFSSFSREKRKTLFCRSRLGRLGVSSFQCLESRELEESLHETLLCKSKWQQMRNMGTHPWSRGHLSTWFLQCMMNHRTAYRRSCSSLVATRTWTTLWAARAGGSQHFRFLQWWMCPNGSNTVDISCVCSTGHLQHEECVKHLFCGCGRDGVIGCSTFDKCECMQARGSLHLYGGHVRHHTLVPSLIFS